MSCKTLVKLGPGGKVIKTYKNKVEGTRECGGISITVEAVDEQIYGYGGWTDTQYFDRLEVICDKCGTVRETYTLTDLEQMIYDQWA